MTPLPSSEPRTPGTGRLAPAFICRLSGAPVDGLDALRAPRAAALLERLTEAEAGLAREREEVAELLFAAVGATTDRPLRNRLLKAKRDLYNLRALPRERLDELAPALDPAAAERVRGFAAALEERDRVEAELRRAHAEESAEARDGFRELLRDADFRKGLLVSSRSLHGTLERYEAAGGDPGGREEKTERGLLRYYTRMAAKATPFATFCAIVGGTFREDGADGAGALLRLDGDPRAKRSYVRLNKLLYGVLLDHLKTRPDVRRALVVEPNPTLRTDDGRLVYLTALDSREVFQRMAPNEVLELIAGVFRDRPAPTLGELVSVLCTDPQVEATPEEATAYLDKLLEIGFLRFRTGIREQDADWDLPLRALLGRIDDDHARRACALLERLRERTEAYAAAAPEERAALIAEMHEMVREALEGMEVKGRLRRDMPFYEDATAAARASIALTPGLARTVATLEEWVRLTARLAWPRAEQAGMRHFFDTYYGAGAGGVPLLKFYEDFYREHFKAHVEKEQKVRAGVRDESVKGYDVANPFGLEFIRELGAARSRLAERFRARWAADPDAEEVSVTLDEVCEALEGVPEQPVPCRSVDAFACLVPAGGAGGEPRLLLQGGSYTAGYGKYYSRFLYMLPDDVLAAVRQGNEALTTERLAEICGDAQFNANLHPPLLRWEISYPTGESGATDAQLPGAGLVVEADPADPHHLVVRHAATGARVIPVDLGFLNPRMRPPLYQLLSRFTPPVTFAPSLPESPEPPRAAASASAQEPEAQGPQAPGAEENAPAEAAASAEVPASAEGEAAPAPEPRIVHRPRVSVEGRVVLARRRWMVPGALFPQRRGDEDAADFFVRVGRWRAEHGLPETCYVRIAPLPDPAARKPGEPAPAAEAVPDEQEAAMGEAGPAAATGEDAEEAAAEPAEAGTEGDAAAATKRRTPGSRDLHKPQFIDFSSPLLVGLLGKMAANLKHFQAVVEERLPARDDLPRHDGRAYAAELVVQLDFPAAAAQARAADPTLEEAHVVA